MEVVLLQDVKTLGKKDSIVTVNDGYARNFLFPKKLAVEATKANLNTVMSKVGSLADADDHVLVYTFGHGGDNGGSLATSKGSEYLQAWGSGRIYASEFADMALKIKAGYQTYLFAECYSGGMLEALNTDRSGMRIYGASAANHYTEAVVFDGEMAGFHVQVTNAFRNGVSTTAELTAQFEQDLYRAEDGGFEKGGDFQIFGTDPFTAETGADPAANIAGSVPASLAEQYCLAAIFDQDGRDPAAADLPMLAQI